jgi:hypothetical protein
LAAGGAHTFVGYASGKEDADRVVSELSNHGASARSVHLDVRAVDSSELWEILPDSSTIDLFYFATPPITPGPESGFSTDLYQQFSEFYVAGPATLMAALVHHGHRVRCLLCPSTVYVTNPPERMTEYAVAKTASEALCKILATKVSGLITYAPRWPRLPTDQTVSVISDDFADPAEVVLGSLRELYQLSTNSMYRTADTSVAGGEGS